MPKRRLAAQPGPMLPGLTLYSAATRADELLRERERLLREVNKKKQQLDRARAAAERAQDDRAARMEPLVARHDSLIEQLESLFDELLAEGRLAARARKAVERVRSSLELQGILPFSKDPDEPDFEDEDFDQEELEEYERERGFDPEMPRDSQPSSGPREVPSARQPGADSRTLREIFRALVRAVHPDHAREESERVRRTEVMKEVTRAFEQGDLARLIELERAWQSERVLAGEGDSERRCRELERINAELASQSKQLASALKVAKRELKGPLGQLDELFEQATGELDHIATICEFVKLFRDGKISLAAFARGPGAPSNQEEAAQAPTPPRKRRRRR